MKIIVDAMGGDNAPLEIIKGAYLAANEYNLDITLVGNEDVVRKLIAENSLTTSSKINIVNAVQTIEMCDDPTVVVKSKKNSSMAIGLKLLADGEGDAFVSAGSTGALLTGATLIVKRIKGIKRAALAPILPTDYSRVIIIDAGANTENTPLYLEQYGIMGSVYMNKILNVPSPKIGLLNNGTEASKGTPLQIAANELLSKNENLNFIGNIEGRDVMTGAVDVVVSDGFSGNILLKSIEGTAKMLSKSLKAMFKTNLKSMLCAVLLKKQLKEFKDKMDYNKQGGAPLMGISKPVIKAHGSAKADAFKIAIHQAASFSQSGAIDEIAKLYN
ncbi:MAG: phosphate acyltransferase PlsX [Clostridia bacterium]